MILWMYNYCFPSCESSGLRSICMLVKPIPPKYLEFHASKSGIPRANLWNCGTGSGTAELLWNSWNFRKFSEIRCRNLNTLWELSVWNFQAWKFRVLELHTPHLTVWREYEKVEREAWLSLVLTAYKDKQLNIKYQKTPQHVDNVFINFINK